MKRFIVFVLLIFPWLSWPVDRSDFLSSKIPSQLDNADQAIWKISSLRNDGNERNKAVANGTGFFVGANHFITNFHVISSMLLNRPENNIVLSQGENRAYVKGILAVSAVYDLALLEVERISINSLTLKEELPISKRGENAANFLSLRKDLPETSENLFITAYPSGIFARIEKTGDISYEDEEIYAFSVNKYVLTGASGSPVLDEQGQIVGVVSASTSNFLHVIRVNHLREFIAGNVGIKCPNFNSDEAVEFAIAKACIKEEMENFKELVEESSISAQSILFHMLIDFSWDANQSFQWTKRWAEWDHALAQYSLGIMYSKAEGVDQDLGQAFQWMKRSAEQGYVPAQYNLGIMYYEGDGVKQDLSQAFQWIKQSAEQAHASAQYILSIMYYHGEGVDQDVIQAVQWMKRSAEQACSPAQYELAIMYLKGDGVDQDVFQAVQWMERSAEQGYIPAQIHLNEMYINGDEVISLLQWLTQSEGQSRDKRFSMPLLGRLFKNFMNPYKTEGTCATCAELYREK